MKESSLSLMVLIFIILGTSGFSQGKLENRNEYKVVINHEEQYAIWPIKETVRGQWRATKIQGDLAKCQEYINEVWTDMRPLSIRKMNLDKNTSYTVVVNHEEQYSIWPERFELPKGWIPKNVKGPFEKCQEYIEEVWTDMRPLSLRSRKK